MRFIVVAALAIGCTGSVPLEVGGRVTLSKLEGGFWAIAGDDGVTYDPRALPDAFKVEGLPVFAKLVVRNDMVSAHMVGPIVDVLEIEVVPGFSGGWRGTKTYLDAAGTVVASAPDWPFQIRMTSLDKVQFVNGPTATINGSKLVVDPFTYPAAYHPTPSGGGCNPVTEAITSGTGTLSDHGLFLTLHWTESCGGESGLLVTTYDMAPAALGFYEIPQL